MSSRAGACRNHPDAPAVSVCSVCLDPLCGACLLFFRYQPVCATCVPTLQERRSGRLLMMTIAVAVGLLTLGVVVAFFIATYRAPFDYGQYGQLVQVSRDRLASSPCDRQAAVTLGQTMIRAGDARGTIEFAQKFFASCGDEPQLRWSTYTAHQQLGQWDAAIADASKLIESNPSDKDFRWWRAQCYERKGNLANAAADYEKAIELEPRLTNIPVNLANVYERMHRRCDASRVLTRYGEVYPDAKAELGPRAADLGRGCPAEAAATATP